MSAESPPSSPGDGKNPLTFHVLSDPLGDLPADRRIELLGQIGVKAKNDFVSAIAGLDAQVLPYEPTLVLAWFAFYRLMSPGGVDREITEDEPLFPQHLEFLQAFVLRYAEAEFESKPPGPDDYQTLEETLKILSQSAGFRDFEKIKPDQSTEQRAKLHLASTLRVETQAIRNWGYPRQMQRIVKDLFEPLSAAFKERIGSSVTDLITMFERIEELISNRATSHAQAVGDIWQQKTLEEVLRASVRATSVDIDESDFRARMREHGLNLEQVKSMLSHHLDLFLPRVFTLTLDDLIECHPAIRDHGVMAELIGRLTYRFGDLQKEDPDRFFVSNPVWKRPFVSTDAGYLFVNINVCTAFLVEIVEGLIGDDVKLRSRYDRRRGVFLEEETAKQFRQAFPEAQHARRSTWADETSGKEFENDLTVVVDAYLFVVESKGGRLTEAARRGGEARIGRHVGELIVEGAQQAERFAQMLMHSPGVHRFPTKGGGENIIDTSHVERVVRLSVTLDVLGLLATEANEIRDAGFGSESTSTCLSLSLPDLELIFAALQLPSEKIHYLSRRLDFEQTCRYHGDELDILRFYLDNGFNLGDAEFSGELAFQLYGGSKGLDPFFTAHFEGRDMPRPGGKRSDWWDRVLRQVERSKPRGWTILNAMILGVPFDTQVESEAAIERLKEIVRGRPHESTKMDSIMMGVGPKNRQDVFVIYAFRNLTRELRNRYLQHLAAEAVEKATSGCLAGIALDVDGGAEPYSCVAMFRRN